MRCDNCRENNACYACKECGIDICELCLYGDGFCINCEGPERSGNIEFLEEQADD